MARQRSKPRRSDAAVDLAALAALAGDDDVLGACARWRAAGQAVVLCTVVRTSGSTPRKAGARLALAADGAMIGTIGGGKIEHEIVELARALVADGAAEPRLEKRHLTHDLAMCCGGEMEVFVEPLQPAPRLWICGAGHVAQALAPMARAVGFAPLVVDELDTLRTSARFPAACDFRDSFDVRDWGAELDADSYVVVVTRDHAVDQRLMEQLLPRELAYLGLIGSARKVELFRRRLEARGHDMARWPAVHAPIGVRIAARTPAEIAVAIVAELIEVRALRTLERSTLEKTK